jgi:hypothetical protein
MSNELAPEQVSKSNPVLIMTCVLAAYQTFVGGLGTLEVLPDKAVGVLVLGGAAAALGWGMYTKGIVTPWEDVVAKATPQGQVIAGPAAQQETGLPVVVTDASSGEVVAPPPNLDS